MANTLKKKSPPPNPDKLKPEKEVQVSMSEVVKDERTSKIAGAVCLLIAAFLAIAFTSYIFTWQQDQDKVLQFGVKIFNSTDVKVANLMGVLGAYTAHTFIYNGFGLASYLFCTFFFVLGVNLLFAKKVFSLSRNLKYLIIGLVVLPVALTFFTAGSGFSWGGAVGEMINDWLVKWIGKVGTGSLLALALLIYIIWRFNPTFRLPEKKIKQSYQPAEKNDLQVNEFFDEEDAMKAEGSLVRGDGAKLIIDEAINPNKLKTNKGISVIMPQHTDEDENALNDFSVKEKDETVDSKQLTVDT